MKMQTIEAGQEAALCIAIAANAAEPFNLFDATCWTGAKEMRSKDKPRAATDREAALYCAELARRAGLIEFDDYDVIPAMSGRARTIVGITFGECLSPAGSRPVEVVDYERLTTRVEYQRVQAQYEEGAYSVPMPGRGFAEAVTMETLNDAGEVVATSTLPTDGKRQVAWSRAAVRKAVGEVAKPKRARKPVTKAEKRPAERVDAVEATPEPVPPVEALNEPETGKEDEVEALRRRLEAVEAVVAGLATPSVETEAPPPSVENERPSRAVRERLVRRYLAMRAERAKLIEQRGFWKAKADDWQERAREGYQARDEVAKDAEREARRAEGLAHELSELRGQLASKPESDPERRADEAVARVHSMETAFMEMTGRALRAEASLKAIGSNPVGSRFAYAGRPQARVSFVVPGGMQ